MLPIRGLVIALTLFVTGCSPVYRHHGYVPETLLGNAHAWGRRSVFVLDGKPLLVSEVFLPAFPDACDNNGPCHGRT